MNASLPSQLLDVWERVLTLPSSQRDEALLRSVDESARGLGARNAALVKLRASLFGSAWPLRSSCPRCGENCEFSVNAHSLAAELASTLPDAERTYQLSVGDCSISFRLPNADDLVQSAQIEDIDASAHSLLQRCVVDSDRFDLDAAIREELSARMQELDPAAVVSFNIACPSCGDAWHATIDVGVAVWAEIKAAAERTLLDVDTLARAYSWSEPQILALSPLRRAAYLQLAGGT
jgi:hypothetical protein